MDFYDRLKRAVSKFGSVSKTASRIGMSQPALRKWLIREVEPTIFRLEKLSRLTGISVGWMLHGEAIEHKDFFIKCTEIFYAEMQKANPKCDPKQFAKLLHFFIEEQYKREIVNNDAKNFEKTKEMNETAKNLVKVA